MNDSADSRMQAVLLFFRNRPSEPKRFLFGTSGTMRTLLQKDVGSFDEALVWYQKIMKNLQVHEVLGDTFFHPEYFERVVRNKNYIVFIIEAQGTLDERLSSLGVNGSMLWIIEKDVYLLAGRHLLEDKEIITSYRLFHERKT